LQCVIEQNCVSVET